MSVHPAGTEPAGQDPAGAVTATRAGATVVRMVLGAQLRRLREAAQITPEKAGYEIRSSRGLPRRSFSASAICCSPH